MERKFPFINTLCLENFMPVFAFETPWKKKKSIHRDIGQYFSQLNRGVVFVKFKNDCRIFTMIRILPNSYCIAFIK